MNFNLRWEYLLLAGMLVPAFPQTRSSMEDSVAIRQRALEEARARDSQRKEKNREDLRQLQLVDSVGWLKVTAVKRPDESMDQLERERAHRKIAGLLSFCAEDRFVKQSEVDSLGGMTVEERAFCKDRLKLVNPMMP